MSKRDKLRRKLRNNPKGVKYQALETLLSGFGFRLVRVAGSHHVFRSADDSVTIVIPVHGQAVKIPYVKEAIDQLDLLFPETVEASDNAEDDENEQDD